jgi:hypothetical protein
MATPKTSHRSLIALNLPRAASTLAAFSNHVVTCMTGNSLFPSPLPTLAVVTQAINDLLSANTASLTHAKGTATTRNEKVTALVVLLQQLRAYVQAAADANVENGASIIESAGFSVRKTAVRAPRVFDAKPGLTSGTAKLVAKSAGPHSSYEWQSSSDGGKTWTAAPVTIQARTTVGGLPPGTTVQFRYRPVTRTGEGDWSQIVTLLVK